MVYTTESYTLCETNECEEVVALRRRVVDGNIYSCLHTNQVLMVVLDDYYPISLVRIMPSKQHWQFQMFVGNYSELQ